MGLFDGQPLTELELIDREVRRKIYDSSSVTIKDKKGRAVRREPYWKAYGKGPANYTCGDCRFLIKHNTGCHSFFKCGKFPITLGPGTDIRKKDEACNLFVIREIGATYAPCKSR